MSQGRVGESGSIELEIYTPGQILGTGENQMASISYRAVTGRQLYNAKEQWKKDFSMTGSSSPSPFLAWPPIGPQARLSAQAALSRSLPVP